MNRANPLVFLASAGLLVGLGLVACGGDDASTVNPIPGCSPAQETCNGLDDNCNGSVDENLTQPCTEQNQVGTQTCTNGVWGQCAISCVPQAETCNGLDDNCNGAIDENLTQTCMEGTQSGSQTCANGAWSQCVVGCNAQAEICNGLDDDCDSAIDEDAEGNALVRDCVAPNGLAGTQTCATGAWGTCASSCLPEVETCNGQDDDCDGSADEGADGNPLVQVCTDPNGVPGTQTCTGGAWGTCDPGCVSSVETCNGIDDDCDGLTDEDETGSTLRQDCSNQCGLGTEICVNGGWVQCTAPQPATEVCNGVDDDCDGQLDEDFHCVRGSQEPCGTTAGLCELGVALCGADCELGACLGGVQPSTELCDGVNDEDCDGTVDNGCGCTNGQTQDCCDGSQVVCTGGVMPACPPPPLETCNDVDDDCNGDVDDNLPVDPFSLEEDITGVDNCAHADLLSTPVVENGTAQTRSFYLYKPDLTDDRDFFLFKTEEISDLECIIHPTYNECYWLTVRLTDEPAGTDYEFCIYAVGAEGDPYTCQNNLGKFCSTDPGALPNEVTLQQAGGCGFEDGLRYYLEVFSQQGSPQSCQSYTFSMRFVGSGPQQETCFP